MFRSVLLQVVSFVMGSKFFAVSGSVFHGASGGEIIRVDPNGTYYAYIIVCDCCGFATPCSASTMCMQKFENCFKLIIINNNFINVTINEAFGSKCIICF